MGVVGHDDVLFVKLERFAESLAELREVLKRAAEEGNMAANRTTAGQAGDGLRYHTLENGGGDVFLLGAFVEQGLHVGFCEHAATACDGIQHGMVLGKLV